MRIDKDSIEDDGGKVEDFQKDDINWNAKSGPKLIVGPLNCIEYMTGVTQKARFLQIEPKLFLVVLIV
jgi:hypothetical protein